MPAATYDVAAKIAASNIRRARIREAMYQSLTLATPNENFLGTARPLRTPQASQQLGASRQPPASPQLQTPMKQEQPSWQQRSSAMNTLLTPTQQTPTHSTKAEQQDSLPLEVQVKQLQQEVAELKTKYTSLQQELQARTAMAAQDRDGQPSTGDAAGPRPDTANLLLQNELQWRAGLASSIIIRRLPEKQHETSEELQQQVLCLDPFLGSGHAIVSICRVGELRPEGTGQQVPRPVMVTFSSVAAKMAVKRQSWKLAGKVISLDHAITIEQQRLRATQWPQIQAAKVGPGHQVVLERLCTTQADSR
jgi:FtsZ-binding cell division protein ZapB